jgi:hypothetical protein
VAVEYAVLWRTDTHLHVLPSLHSDPDYFSSLIGENGGTSANALSDNWILRFNYLKKLYRLIVRYFECVMLTPDASAQDGRSGTVSFFRRD